MDWLIDIFYYLVPFIVLLGILVFVHELGHFAVAKFVGVKVEEFSLGFGKELWGFNDRSGTRWKVCAVPLGGYVKMLGDADVASATESEDVKKLSEDDLKRTFTAQPPSKKLAITLAGPLANYLFAIAIFTAIFFFLGRLTFPPVIGEVLEGGAAQAAGILKNDRVLEINGKKIDTFADLQREVDLSVDKKADVVIQRGEEVLNIHVTLKELEVPTSEYDSENAPKQQKLLLGVRSVNAVELDKRDLSFAESVKEACVETWDITTATLRGVGQMLTGKRASDDVGGVIRIAEMSGDISKERGLIDFTVFMALLSINLGLINLFPIPVLDGGQAVISIVEMIARREIGEKIKEYMFRFGFGVIMALVIFATWNDLVHLFKRIFV